MEKINRSLAIVIGIDEYTHIPKLKNAVSDAKELANVLKNNYNYEVLLLLNQRATKEKFDELLENFEQKIIEFDGQSIKIEPSDRILFYFAGHGFAEDAQDSEDGKPSGYFMPQNADDGNLNTCLSMQKLYEAFTSLDCHHLLMILDCCFAGRISWVGKGRNAARSRKLYQQSYDHFIKHQTQQIITSAAHDEKAQDSFRFGQRGDINGHSPFAHLLLKILQGNSDGGKDKFIEAILEDKVITAHELFTYLQNQLGKIAEGQTPALSQPRKYDQQTGEYVFLKGEYLFPLHNFNPQDLIPLKLDENTNPYKGLASFEEGDSQLFFGRKRLIEKPKEGLLTKVSNYPLTVVLGTSGSGKSSLVKAGLIPALKLAQESGQQKWVILAPMRPSESPLNALNKILIPLGSDFSGFLSLNYQEKVKIISTNIGQKISPGSKLLLVIDQTEELFTLCQNQEESADFINLLAQLLTTYQENLRIVITLRSEFEPQIRDTIKEKNWQNVWQDGRFIVTPMDREELQQAIEEPAAQRALFFESPKLVNDLIDEVVQMPGALPLLSFTLSELYLKYLKAEEKGDRNDRTITETDYKEIGGVTCSLTQTADKTYKKLVEEQIDESTIRDVMLRMVAISGGELARRRVPISELVYPEPKNEQAKKVIDRFVEARLLVKGLDAEGQEYVESAHDALVRGWDKLDQWRMQEQENLFLQGRLTPAANDWNKLPENEKNQALWTEEEGRLLRLRPVINSDQNWLNKVETDFVNKSIKERRNRLEEDEKQRDEALQGQITALAALSEARFQDDQLGALIHILKAGRILQQLIGSKSQWITQDICLRTEVVLRQILSKVKEFNRLEDKDIPFNSMQTLAFTTSNKLVLIEQGRLITLNSIFRQELILMENILPVKDDNSQNVTKRPVISFWQLNGGLENRGLLESPLGIWNPVTRMLAHFIHRTSQPQQELKANAVRLMNLEGKQVILQKDERDNLMTFAFSPNGQLIASGGWFGELYLWKTDGTTIQQKQTGAGSLNTIDFSPNGDMFATGSRNGEIRLWDQNGDLLRTIEAHRDAIWGVSFSPDGETLASVSTDTTVKIWKTTDATLLTTLNGHREKVGVVCFNSDGQILASASDEGTVRLWRPNGSKLKGLDDHHTGSVYTVRFNPKKPMIATTSGQGQLILWNQDGRLLKTWEKGHHGTITALDFSPNGNMFVTAAGDREVKLWRLDDTDTYLQNSTVHNLGNHTGENHLPTVFGVSFCSDNQTILLGIGSQDGKGSLELCDSESMSCRIIAEYDHQVLAVCFSPNGQMFALGKGDGSVELWRKEEDEFRFLINLNQHDHVVLAVCFSPDGKFLATGSADQTVKLWQIDKILNNTSTTSVTPTNIPAHTDRVTAVCFSPNSDLIATASYDKTVKLWNLDGKLRKTLHGHNDQVNALDFSPDGQILASASNDKTAILWNLELELGLDQLIDYGCEWISGYLMNNSNVSESNRKVLSPEEFPTLKYDSHKWV